MSRRWLPKVGMCYISPSMLTVAEKPIILMMITAVLVCLIVNSRNNAIHTTVLIILKDYWNYIVIVVLNRINTGIIL